MKINWFSPLPPAKTSIAYTTRVLLPALSRRAEITLWTDQPEWNKNLEQWAIVRRFDPDELNFKALNQAEMTFYHLGNNCLFHSAIWNASQRYPGVIILHDLRLQHFFAGFFRARSSRSRYVAEMSRCHGEPGRYAAEAFWTGQCSADDLAKHFPLTELALRNSLGVVVHTQAAFAEIKQMERRPVGYLFLPEIARDSTWPETVTGPTSRCQLIMFGHMGANRRVESVLKALATLPERDRFCLNIFGELWNESQIRSQIDVLGLQAIVHLGQFVAEEDLQQALAASDLGINLRYPTMGEASGSQLQLWAHSLPSLVTPVGFYSDLPADTVAFVRPDHEIEDIQLHLRNFLAQPDRFRQMGLRGREFLVKHHSPEVYVESLLQMVQQATEFRQELIVTDLANRAGKELGNWFEPDQLESSCQRTARAISGMLCQ